MVIVITERSLIRKRKPFIKLFNFYTHMRVFISINRIVGDRRDPVKMCIVLFVRTLCLFHI